MHPKVNGTNNPIKLDNATPTSSLIDVDSGDQIYNSSLFTSQNYYP
jgi:hypothetical protein